MKFATILQNMEEYEFTNWLCDSKIEFAKSFITTVFSDAGMDEKAIGEITSILDNEKLRKEVFVSTSKMLDTNYTFTLKPQEVKK